MAPEIGQLGWIVGVYRLYAYRCGAANIAVSAKVEPPAIELSLSVGCVDGDRS